LYTVGVADCGSHDNQVDKLWYNEQWLGYPVDESVYAYCSNIPHAHKLQSSQRLMLIVGERDHNVDPQCTYRLAEALQRENKDFELVVLMGTGHSAADTPYGRRKLLQFFHQNLK
jgi:dipeptidyl aminopeptidase/acylaminoacyl peptidase